MNTSKMLKSTAEWCVLAEIVCVMLGSQMTTSASDPTAMQPYKDKRKERFIYDSLWSSLKLYLFGIHVEDFSGIRRGNGDEASRVHFASHNSFRPDQRHALFDAVHAVWNFGEIIFAQLLLSRRESAMIRSSNLQIVAVLKKKEKLISQTVIEK